MFGWLLGKRKNKLTNIDFYMDICWNGNENKDACDISVKTFNVDLHARREGGLVPRLNGHYLSGTDTSEGAIITECINMVEAFKAIVRTTYNLKENRPGIVSDFQYANPTIQLDEDLINNDALFTKLVKDYIWKWNIDNNKLGIRLSYKGWHIIADMLRELPNNKDRFPKYYALSDENGYPVEYELDPEIIKNILERHVKLNIWCKGFYLTLENSEISFRYK